MNFTFDESKEILSRAIIRLNYLFPKSEIELKENTIVVKGDFDSETIKQEVNKIVYSEKIYLETLDIREKIFNDL